MGQERGDLLDRLESYYDEVPRSRTRAEEIGPFTLFVAEKGWPYYGRPRRGCDGAISPDDLRRLLRRQRELGVPQSMEWVDENTPGLLDTVYEAGLDVQVCPLLVLEGEPRGTAGSARILGPEDPDLLASLAAISVGFDHEGTAAGPAGASERDAFLADKGDALEAGRRVHMAAGRLFQAAVYVPEAEGPVGGGSYSPEAGVAEITGVAVLPAFRRRGLAAQLTYVLAAHAREHGVETVFCSAESADVARVYEGIGFRRIGTACIAEAAPPP